MLSELVANPFVNKMQLNMFKLFKLKLACEPHRAGDLKTYVLNAH